MKKLGFLQPAIDGLDCLGLPLITRGNNITFEKRSQMLKIAFIYESFRDDHPEMTIAQISEVIGYNHVTLNRWRNIFVLTSKFV